MEAKVKKSLLDSIMDWLDVKLTPKLAKFSNFPVVKIIVNTMMSTVGILVIGSMFLLFNQICITWVPALNFLAAPALRVYSLTMLILSLYTCISLSYNFANIYRNVDRLQLMLFSIAAYMVVAVPMADGNIETGSFAASNMFVVIIVGLVTGYIFKFCKDKNLGIKMPAGVPDMISESFSGLLPGFLALLFWWVVTDICQINLVAIATAIITPLFQASENIFVYTFRWFVGMCISMMGIHADALIGGVLNPMIINFTIENAEAIAAGVAADALPHVWTGGLDRIAMSNYALLILCLTSKAKSIKELGKVAAIPVLFTIGEPLQYGLPLVLNPILMIPQILASTVTAFVSYLVTSIGWVSSIYVELPWFTPPPIYALVGTGGDWRALVLWIVNNLIFIVIFLPFFKQFEKQTLAQENEE